MPDCQCRADASEWKFVIKEFKRGVRKVMDVEEFAHAIYGIAALEREIRFHVQRSGNKTLKEYSRRIGEPYDLKAYEAQIDSILREIRTIILRILREEDTKEMEYKEGQKFQAVSTAERRKCDEWETE